MNSAKSFYGWKLVGVLWMLDFMNMGFPLYGGSIINTYMLNDMQMSRSIFGMAHSLFNLALGVSSVVIAAVIVRWGIRATFGIGSALLIFGSLWMAFVTSQPWHYLFGFGIIIGSGIGFGTVIPLSTALTRWFRHYRGRAMAIAMTASGVAGFIASPIADRFLAASGGNWRLAWVFVACIAFLSGIVAYFFVKERPEDLGQSADGISEEDAGMQQVKAEALSTSYTWTPAEACKTLPYWLFFVGSIACQFPFTFLMAHWVLHLKGMGITAADAAFAMGLFTMGGIAGRLIGGWLMDRIPARFVFMLGLCCTMFGSLLAIGADRPVVAYLAAILMGVGFGWTYIALSAAMGNFYGSEAFPRLMGIMMLMSSISCSPAGFVGGKIFDMYQSYTPAFVLIMTLCLAAILALSFAKIPQPRITRIDTV